MIVNHANPIHDRFCRCRNCKPSLVARDRTHRVLWALGVMLSLGMILCGVWG